MRARPSRCVGVPLFLTLALAGCSGGGASSAGPETLPTIIVGAWVPPSLATVEPDPLVYLGAETVPALRLPAGVDAYLETSADPVFAAFDIQAILLESQLLAGLPAGASLRPVAPATGSASVTPVDVNGWTVGGSGTLTTDFGPGLSGQGLGIDLSADKAGVHVALNVATSASAPSCPDAKGRVPGAASTSVVIAAESAKGKVRVSAKVDSTFSGQAGASGATSAHALDATCVVEVSGQRLDAGSGTLVAVPTSVYRIRFASPSVPPLSGWDVPFVSTLVQQATAVGPGGRLDLSKAEDAQIVLGALQLLAANELQVENALADAAKVGCGDWTGTSSVTLINSSPVYKLVANVKWVQDSALSAGNVAVYHPEGTVSLEMLIGCLAITPASQAVTQADGVLRVDSSTSPATWTGSTTTPPWSATYAITCGTPTSYPGTAGGPWFGGSGLVAPDGKSIAGTYSPSADLTFTYLFTRK